jgi:predicted GIY-YIG superfamily endonuclease
MEGVGAGERGGGGKGEVGDAREVPNVTQCSPKKGRQTWKKRRAFSPHPNLMQVQDAPPLPPPRHPPCDDESGPPVVNYGNGSNRIVDSIVDNDENGGCDAGGYAEEVGEAADAGMAHSGADADLLPSGKIAWPPLLQPMMCVYMLSDEGSRRTYVGATVDLKRRIRQHNGELAGGARRTHGRAWDPCVAVTGFGEWKDALRFEYAWRRVCRRCKGRGVEWRMRGLVLLMSKTRWSSTSPLASTVPLVVHTKDAEAWVS